MRKWLIITRKNLGLTQMGIADCVGISRAYYAQIELHKRNPSVRVAKNIALQLGFSWTLFFEESGSGA